MKALRISPQGDVTEVELPNDHAGRFVEALRTLIAAMTIEALVRDSPQTVETSVVVIMASMAGLLAPVPGRGRLVACPLFLLPGAAAVSGVKGGPQGPSPAGRCGAPLRPEGRPRTLSGRKKASGGAAASFFSWPAQRARRAHAASFPARDRS